MTFIAVTRLTLDSNTRTPSSLLYKVCIGNLPYVVHGPNIAAACFVRNQMLMGL